MTDRDDLYAIMDRIFDEYDMPPGRYEIADAILAAGWTPPAPLPPNAAEVTGRSEWEQHRAADELTQHDQAAGHYDCDDCNTREQRPHRRSYDGRADQHGPHED